MGRVRTLVLSVGLGAAVIGGYVVVQPDPPAAPPRFCHADGIVGTDGQIYARDDDQDCQFVDQDGRVLTEDEVRSLARGGTPG